MNTPRDVRVGTLSGDERCRRCGGENVNWCAPSPLWNEVMRGGSINGDPQFDDLVCPRCFIVLTYEADIDGQWHLFVDPEPDGLQKVTPSGRVWDAESWMWREPAHALDAVPDVPPDPPAADLADLRIRLRDAIGAEFSRWLFDDTITGPDAAAVIDALLSSGVLVDAADVRARALKRGRAEGWDEGFRAGVRSDQYQARNPYRSRPPADTDTGRGQ